MTDDAEEIEVYVDPELLTKAKGALMLENGREPTDEKVIGEALQAFVDEHTETDERRSLDLSAPAGFDSLVDESQQIGGRSTFEPLFDDERHYPDSFGEGLRRAERRVEETDSNSADKEVYHLI